MKGLGAAQISEGSSLRRGRAAAGQSQRTRTGTEARHRNAQTSLRVPRFAARGGPTYSAHLGGSKPDKTSVKRLSVNALLLHSGRPHTDHILTFPFSG